MIRVFSATDRDFRSNGDAVLRPYKAVIHKEDNANFYLNLECGLEYIDLLTNGSIIVANLPKGDQSFRISNPVVTKNKITTKAQHVFFDTKNHVVIDASYEDKTCGYVLNDINTSAFPNSPFTVDTDIEDSGTDEIKHCSMYDALQKVIGVFGGHFVRDNFRISIKKSIETDNGVQIRYAKNLKDITCEENWNNVCTIVYPIGRDGLTLPEEYIESEIQYDVPYCKVVSFNQDISEEDYKDENGELDEDAFNEALIEDLRSQATQYVEDHCLPDVNYKLKADIERITDVGDVISVIDNHLGLNILTNVIAFDYDCILKRFTNIEFGNFTPTLANLINTVSNDAKKSVSGEITNAVDKVNERIDNIVPEGGSVGQVLTKTASGSAWQSLPLYDGSYVNE